MTDQVDRDVTRARTNSQSEPDFNDAQGFLTRLAPKAVAYRFRTFGDAGGSAGKCRKYHGSLAAVATSLRNANRERHGVFFAVNDGGDTDRSITEIRAVFADTDGAPIDPIMRCGLDPHIVVESSPGKWHVYWFVTGLPVEKFRAVQRRIAYRFGTDRSVINESRVMRLPGFNHHKGEPYRVHQMHESGMPAFTAEEVLEAFPPLAEFTDRADRSRAKDRSAEARLPYVACASSYANGALRRAAAIVACAVAGSRNDTLNRQAYSLAGFPGLTDRMITEALETAARAAGLSDGEISATIASGIASGRHAPREAPQPREHGGADEGRKDGPSATGQPESEPAPAPAIFTHVDLSDLGQAKLEIPKYVVNPLIATGVVTMLSGHGGSGKTMLSLIIGAHVAFGRPWGPYVFDQGRVLFVALEDPGKGIRVTLARVCAHYCLDAKAVAENFTMIDGTAVESALAAELSEFGGKRLVETAAYAELKALAAGFDLIIVDNASDAFDGNENERRQVRKFVRGMLGQIARVHECAVMLLAHIDKAAAKFGGKRNTYTGSTAWHNSARSRLAIIEDDAGGCELVHEKNNLSKRAEPLPLKWTKDGMLVPAEVGVQGDSSESDAPMADADDAAVFEALTAAIKSGATITAKRQGPSTTLGILQKYDGLPPHLRARQAKGRFWAAISRLERNGRIVVQEYINADRKPRSRWAIAPVDAT